MLLGALGVGGVLAGCGGSPSTAPPAPDIPRRLHTRWRTKPDGPLPTDGDDGVPFTVITLSGIQPVVENGALVGRLPDEPSATYVTQRMDRRVSRIGATFGFGPGDVSGTLALLAVDDSTADPRGHCHLAITPDRWIAGVVTDGYEVEEVDRGRFDTALRQDRSPLTVDIRYRADTATIELPDGSRRSITDSRFGGSPRADIACWEFYQATGSGAEVHLYETWAG